MLRLGVYSMLSISLLMAPLSIRGPAVANAQVAHNAATRQNPAIQFNGTDRLLAAELNPSIARQVSAFLSMTAKYTTDQTVMVASIIAGT